MSSATELQASTHEVHAIDRCSICTTTTPTLLVSCASLDCVNRIHITCAHRPQGTRLHFCSQECAMSYYNR